MRNLIILLTVVTLLPSCARYDKSFSGLSALLGEEGDYWRGKLLYDHQAHEYVRHGEWVQIAMRDGTKVPPATIVQYSRGEKKGPYYNESSFGYYDNGKPSGINVTFNSNGLNAIIFFINGKRNHSISSYDSSNETLAEYHKRVGEGLVKYINLKHEHNLRLLQSKLSADERSIASKNIRAPSNTQATPDDKQPKK